MIWYEGIHTAIAVLATFFIIFVVPFLLVELIDKLFEQYRRQKYPEYFEMYDTAKKMSFEVGVEFRRRTERIEYYRVLYTDGLREGECTSEYFKKKMSELAEEYQDVCIWFKEASESVEKLWVQADLYAKEHDLSWGIIYGSKCT
jgi:hypothetical protein